MILMNKKRFPQTSCCKAYSPNFKIWERGEAFGKPHTDLLLFAVCFPPKTNKVAKVAGIAPESKRS